MSLTKKVFKNVSYLMVARVVFRFLTAAVMIYAARYLGVDRFGMFETALAWANAFLALNDIGMSTLIVREAARDEKKMAVYFGNTLVVEVLCSLVLYAAIIGIGFGLHYDATTITLMAVLGAAGLAFEFRKVARGIFRVFLQLKTVALLEILNGVLYFLITAWIIYAVADKDTGLLAIAHSRLWIDVFIVIALLLYTFKFVRPAFSARQIWPMIKQSYVFTLYNMFFMLYFQIDQIILSIMRDKTEVGIYSASAKLVSAFLFIPLMVFQVTMPIMYRYSRDNIEKYKRINRTIWRYLAAFGLPAGVGLWLLAPEITGFVYGEEYLASVVVLQIMGWFMAIRFFGISQGNSMTTTDRQGLRAGIQIASVGVNIVLDIYLISKYGARGAAIATLITECLIAGSYIYLSGRYLRESLFASMRSFIPVFLATAGMLGLLALIKPYVHVIVLVIFGMAAYTGLLWLFRFFTPYDKNILKEALSKKSS
ncbi:MAG: flippase [Candidatus Kerfeldbacteria bacterium]